MEKGEVGGPGGLGHGATERDWQQLIGRRLEHIQNNDDTISSEVGTLIHREAHQNLPPGLYQPPGKGLKGGVGPLDTDESTPMVRLVDSKLPEGKIRR